MMPMPKCPCYGCIDRSVGCHASCQKYLDFRSANDKMKHAILKDKMIDAARDSILFDGLKPIIRKRRKK